MELNLKKVQLYGYALPLRFALTTQGTAKRSPAGAGPAETSPAETSPAGVRRGLLLALHDRQDRVGWGEIAPLPGLHPECLQQAKLQAQYLLRQLLHGDAVACDLNGCGTGQGVALSSCVRWGVDTATAHLQRLQQAQRPRHSTTLALNALVPPDGCSQMMSHAHKLLRLGCRCLKFKVGHLLPVQAASLVRCMYGLCKACGANMRVDVGGRWSLRQALQFGQHVRPHWVQYVEEPVVHPRHIPQLHARTGLWFALDDTLHCLPADQWIGLSGVCAWVVKPSLLTGGLRQWHDLLRQAQQRNVDVVLSSCFESSLGLRHIACLAGNCVPVSAVAGLLTSSWFIFDVMPSMHRGFRSSVHLPTLMQQLDAFDARRSAVCRLLWEAMPNQVV